MVLAGQILEYVATEFRRKGELTAVCGVVVLTLGTSALLLLHGRAHGDQSGDGIVR